MRASLGWTFGLVVGLTLLAPGCNRQSRQRTLDDPAARDAVATDVNSRTNRSAIRAIATARCDREERCRNLGADKKFASKEACLDRIRADWASELNAFECPNGIAQVELDECLQDIRDEDCGNPFDTLARTFSCSKTEICTSD